MKREIKTKDAVAAYGILSKLKLGKVALQSRFKVIRAARALKSIATAQSDFEKDAAERLKPEGWDTLQKHLKLGQEPQSDEELKALEVFLDYDRAVAECIKPQRDKLVEFELQELLCEDELSALAEENVLTVEQLLLLEDVVGQAAATE